MSRGCAPQSPGRWCVRQGTRAPGAPGQAQEARLHVCHHLPHQERCRDPLSLREPQEPQAFSAPQQLQRVPPVCP